MKPRNMVEVHNKVKYDTSKAELIADNSYWDGHNFERHGRNTFLYKGSGGRYFALHMTCWQGEKDSIEPLSQEAAIELYESLHDEDAMDFEDAFPNVSVVEA